MKPSDIDVFGVPPLVGTMGKSEVELAAAILVRVLALNGDIWRAVSLQEAAAVETVERERLKGKEAGVPEFWTIPPFISSPDFHELVERGYASFDDQGGAPPDIAFTEKGLEALKSWRRV